MIEKKSMRRQMQHATARREIRTFRILDREGVPRRTVFHCFTGGVDEATAALSRGALLSISGIVTFKGADDVYLLRFRQVPHR